MDYVTVYFLSKFSCLHTKEGEEEDKKERKKILSCYHSQSASDQRRRVPNIIHLKLSITNVKWYRIYCLFVSKKFLYTFLMCQMISSNEIWNTFSLSLAAIGPNYKMNSRYFGFWVLSSLSMTTLFLAPIVRFPTECFLTSCSYLRYFLESEVHTLRFCLFGLHYIACRSWVLVRNETCLFIGVFSFVSALR